MVRAVSTPMTWEGVRRLAREHGRAPAMATLLSMPFPQDDDDARGLIEALIEMLPGDWRVGPFPSVRPHAGGARDYNVVVFVLTSGRVRINAAAHEPYWPSLNYRVDGPSWVVRGPRAPIATVLDAAARAWREYN